MGFFYIQDRMSLKRIQRTLPCSRVTTRPTQQQQRATARGRRQRAGNAAGRPLHTAPTSYVSGYRSGTAATQPRRVLDLARMRGRRAGHPDPGRVKARPARNRSACARDCACWSSGQRAVLGGHEAVRGDPKVRPVPVSPHVLVVGRRARGLRRCPCPPAHHKTSRKLKHGPAKIPSTSTTPQKPLSPTCRHCSSQAFELEETLRHRQSQFAGEERSRSLYQVKKNNPTQRKQHRASQPPLYCMRKEGEKKKTKTRLLLQPNQSPN
jgi:hypothetical protein